MIHGGDSVVDSTSSSSSSSSSSSTSIGVQQAMVEGPAEQDEDEEVKLLQTMICLTSDAEWLF